MDILSLGLQHEKISGDWLQNNVNIHNTTELKNG